jgi:hypothetical protein
MVLMQTRRANGEGDIRGLQRAQDDALGFNLRRPISTPQEAAGFVSRVGIALRYGPTKGLPLASLYRAIGGPHPDKPTLARCISLTNRLLAEAQALEVQVIADRVTLVHRSLMPPLYALCRRGRALDDVGGLSLQARTALSLLKRRREVTAGEVRQRLGLAFDARRDPAYAALSELQHLLLVDRGPFQIPKAGIPYLSKEGYPYHLLHEVHPDLVRSGARYSVDSAAEEFLGGYLRGAAFARVRKLASLFKIFLSADEIETALGTLAEKGTVTIKKVGRDTIVLGRRAEA